jgi:hypothetical protein
MLKEKLEPTALAEKLQAKKILSDEAIENINKCLSRQGKNDTLIQELCLIEPNNANSCIDYEGAFVSLLNDTNQKDVELQLYYPGTNVLRQKCQGNINLEFRWRTNTRMLKTSNLNTFSDDYKIDRQNLRTYVARVHSSVEFLYAAANKLVRENNI